MAAIVTGASLGLTNSSLAVLGPQGQIGGALHGGSGERVYVNSATGNLVLQRHDEVVLGVGNDISILRTYNSRGLLDDDNGDNWRIGLYRRVYALTGTANAAGSTVTRTDADGADAVGDDRGEHRHGEERRHHRQRGDRKPAEPDGRLGVAEREIRGAPIKVGFVVSAPLPAAYRRRTFSRS